MINLKNMNLNVNLKMVDSYKQKLKELKTWAQVKSPRALQTALSYTLGWLSPELLGTGFRMIEISDFEIQALVPAESGNFDNRGQINQGLVLNGCFEMANSFISRHMPDNFYQIVSSDLRVSKKQKWNGDLKIKLVSDENTLDQFFIDLQENKESEIKLLFEIEITGHKKVDTVDLKLMCEPTHLLA
jgi:hypothetical protein